MTSRQYRAQLRAYSGLPRRRSIKWDRLSFDRSFTNSITSSGEGGVPARSKWILRTNSTSDMSGAGSTLGFVLLRYWLTSRSSSAEVRLGGVTARAGRRGRVDAAESDFVRSV